MCSCVIGQLNEALQQSMHRPYAPAAAAVLSPSSGGAGAGATGPAPAHLYQQIVELNELVATLERRVQEKDIKIGQLSAQE